MWRCGDVGMWGCGDVEKHNADLVIIIANTANNTNTEFGVNEMNGVILTDKTLQQRRNTMDA